MATGEHSRLKRPTDKAGRGKVGPVLFSHVEAWYGVALSQRDAPMDRIFYVGLFTAAAIVLYETLRMLWLDQDT